MLKTLSIRLCHFDVRLDREGIVVLTDMTVHE